jgi:hypothetical protein
MNQLHELRTDELTEIEASLGVVGFAVGLAVVAGGAFAIGYTAGYSAAQ